MKLFTRATGFGLLFSLCYSLFSPVAAQSVDACMQSKGATAIDICSKTLANGSRNQNVYYKLGSELYQQGDSSAALEFIDKGLKLHPNDLNLTRLRTYVDIDSVETTQLKQSAKKNQSAINVGKLKITCRTKSTTEGLSACKEYLSRTNVDKKLISQRIAVLEKSLTPNNAERKPVKELVANATAVSPNKPAQLPATPTRSELPKTRPSSNVTNSDPAKPRRSAPQGTVAINQAQSDLKDLIYDVQSSLRHLGFKTGKPDGIPGVRTRQALTDFYKKTTIPDNEFSQNGFISKSTLQDLIKAIRDRRLALKLLRESQQAANENNNPLALLKLNQATSTSAFVTPPTGYKADLTYRILAARKVPPTQEDQPKTATTIAATTNHSATALTALSEVLQQLKQLEIKVAELEKNRQESVRMVTETGSSLRF